MKKLLKNRTALSTVVTTLIILVVSVLLAGVVTYFAINVVSTRVQEESLNLQYTHVWFSTTVDDGAAEAAVIVTNTGGRDVVLQNIAVRGQNVPTANLFYFYVATVGDLAYITQTPTNITAATLTSLAGTHVIPATGNTTFIATTGSIVLTSGSTIAIYMRGGTAVLTPPGSVTVDDVGLTIAISIFTAQATYYKETNVNAA